MELSGSRATTRYVYSDHLGSVDVITNAAGFIEQKLSFDAFGKRRAVFNLNNQPVALTLATILNLAHRGFTGHLQVDHANVIHMGGRIYDAHIGRFLQADPFVQAPSNSQSHNRYSYVLNNPLSYTDPSGYFFKKLKQFAAVIVGAALVYFTGGMASPFVATWYGAAAAGAIAGAVGAAVNGGSILKGAVWGAFSAAAFYGVGSAFGEVAFGSGAHMLKTAAHGLVGGAMNTLQGGKFGHGFAAAGVAQFAAPGIDGIDAGNDFSTGRIALSAIAGGTASKLSGGKFANGAVTGAFSRMFNDELEKNKRKIAEQSVKDNQNTIDRVLAARMRAATVDEMQHLAKMSIEELRTLFMGQGFEGITNSNLRISQMEGVKQLETLAHQLNSNDFLNSGTPMVLNSSPLGSAGQAFNVLGATISAAFNPIGISVWWQCSSSCTIQSVYYADKHINRTMKP